MKVQISIDDDLVKRVDEHARENYTSRSGVITIACTQYLNAQDMTRYIKLLATSMRKIADSGEIDDETYEQLKDFERFVKVLSGGK